MMTLMGQMGQQQDYAKGLQMLRLAAENADENAPQGAYVLGMLQVRELPQVTVPEALFAYNEEQSRLNIEKAAYLGFSKAQLKMGSAYELCTLGCEFDPALSLHYNSLAARQAEPDAEMAISKWFLCGYEGIFPKNEELAYLYAERAAQSGLATAEFAMGYFNEIGMHVPSNLAIAKEWYEKAATQGNADAQQRIESLRANVQLSKKDHEQVAINRIKSQYGSRRGPRPERLKAKAMPALPTLSDSGEDGYGLPPRTSSTAPYPMTPLDQGPPPRTSSAAPYPLDNGPPRGGYGGQQQGRRTSASAFMLNPALQGQPARPATMPNDMRPPAGAYGADSGGSRGGYGGPRPGEMGYNGGRPGGPQQQRPPQGGDFGYVAPLQPRKSPQPSPVGGQFAQGGPGRGGPGGPGGLGGQGGRPVQGGGRGGPGPGPGAGGRGAGPQRPGNQTGLKPPKPPTGNGPKTFAEMGIPQQPKESDCVSILPRAASQL
jgi:TPR repeat protein